jgi:hypothetical protein
MAMADCASPLVDDVLLQCFEEILANRDGDFIRFVRFRQKLASVSRRFRDLVLHRGSFWSQIVITPRLPADVLRIWVSRARDVPMDVTIDFSDASRFYRRGDLSARIYTYLRVAIPAMLAWNSTWNSLRIYGVEPACCEFLLGTLPSGILSTATRLILSCIPPSLDSTPLHSRTSLRRPLPCICGESAILTHLTLDSVGLDWDLTAILPSLLFLELRGISRSNFVLAQHYNNALARAIELRRLVLHSSD